MNSPDNRSTEAMKMTFKGKAAHFWKKHVRPLLILILVFTSFRSSIADWNDVPTGSMKPTIIEGDRIYVNKLAYGLKVPFTTWHLAKWSAPEKGEIVVFYSPTDGTRLVKRVAGVPGDKLQLINNVLYINGEAMKYSDLEPDYRNALTMREQTGYTFKKEQLGEHAHPVMLGPSQPGNPNLKQTTPVYTLEKDQYFMLGDNRDNSGDSRYFTGNYVMRDQIVGRASRIIFSLNYDNYYLPRGSRWFKYLP
jgi:signal peptidase I